MTSRVCPRCGRHDTRFSVRRGIGDSILACFGLAPYRCRACRNRFFRFHPGQLNGNQAPPEVEMEIEISSPSATPSSAAPAPVESAHPLSSVPIAHSLLVVSRDPAIRKLLCKLLTRPGYHTHQLADPAQLPSELLVRKVDLVIADLDEPEQQGLQTIAALRGVYPNLQLIALSGVSAQGADRLIVLSKPFPRQKLLECVQSALVDAAVRLPAGSAHG